MAATPDGLGLFDPLTGKPSQFWKFIDENVTVSPGQDQDELIINNTSRGKKTNKNIAESTRVNLVPSHYNLATY